MNLLALLAVGMAVLLTATGLFELAAAGLFRRLLVGWRPPQVAEEDLPPAALLLGLRGADPFLGESLRRLFTQNYPDYEVRIVVDSRDDPAWQVCEKAIAESGATRVVMEEYVASAENGLLNCTTSKVVQAARMASEDREVWAMADADMVPGSDWLRELIAPLVVEEQLGATFGNRWFRPEDSQFGSLVRYAWNAVAVVAMYVFGMPWGGCFAIRTSAVRRGNLLTKWAKVVAIDAAAHGDLKKQGLRVAFVPGLLVINRESCGLPFALNFIRRQLTWTRLYHGNWLGVVAIAGVIVAFDTSLLGLAVASVILGAWYSLGWLMGGLAVFLAGSIGALAVLDGAVSRVTATGGKQIGQGGAFSIGGLVRLAVVVPLAFVVHVIAVFQATFFRRVKWRGLLLEVGGPEDVRVIEESSTAQQELQAEGKASL